MLADFSKVKSQRIRPDFISITIIFVLDGGTFENEVENKDLISKKPIFQSI